MKDHDPSPRCACAAAAAAATLLALAGAGAQAAGFQISEQNISGLGAVYAGQAALADDASAVFYNPAQLPRLKAARGQVSGGVAYIKPDSRFNDDGSCAPYLGTGAGTTGCPFGPAGNLGHANGGTSKATDGAIVPHLYAATALQPGLWLGLGISSPFGLTNDRDAGWLGRFHAIDSEARAININPAIAWGPQGGALSVGAGLNAERLSAKLSSAVSYRAVALSTQSPALIGAVPAGTEGTVQIKGNDWGLGWNVGVGVDFSKIVPAARVNLGLAYRSKVKFTLDGDARFRDRPAALGSVPALSAALGDGNVKAAATLPDIASVALAWEAVPNQLTLLADWTRTGWHTLQDLPVVRTDGPLAGQTLSTTAFRLQNTRRVGIGAAWTVTPDWTLRAGFAVEKSAATDAYRTPRLPDEDRKFYGVGARWNVPATLVPGLAVDIAVAYSHFDTARVAVPNQDTATASPRGSLVGSFNTHALIFGTQLTWSF